MGRKLADRRSRIQEGVASETSPDGEKQVSTVNEIWQNPEHAIENVALQELSIVELAVIDNATSRVLKIENVDRIKAEAL